LLELRRISEQIKVNLSLAGGSGVTETVLLGSHAVRVGISREAFERSIAPLVDETERLTRRCLEGAGISARDVDTVLLVGGSSFVPLVQQRVRAMFNGDGQRVLYHEPMKAVAFGAALDAMRRSGHVSESSLPAEFRGVTGYHVGIRALDPTTGRVLVDSVIKKNMPLPARAKRVYYTTNPTQQRIVLEIVQYLEGPESAVSLGQLVVGPILAPELNYPIQVAIETAEDGTVAVSALDPRTGSEITSTFGQDRADGVGHLAMQRQLVRATIVNAV
jgi:molecular chaperone DnaK